MTAKRILITGGAGFIGSHLANYWLSQGAEVTIIDSFRTGHRSNLQALNKPVNFVEGTVEDGELLLKLTNGIDIIHHLAAVVSVPESVERPQETESINGQGTLNVLEAARQNHVGRVVFSSSSAVYGTADRPIHRETDQPGPISPYAVTKLAGEFWMSMYRELHGVGAVSLRYFNVYGPRQDPKSPYAAAIAIFSEKARNNEPLTIFGDGSQTRDFVFVEDIVAANVLAATAEELPPPVMNVACSGSITVKQLAETIVDLSNSQSEIRLAPTRAGDVMHSRGDSTLLRSLGWTPKVSLEEGLRRTINNS